MSEPRWVVLETSGQPGVVALAHGGQLLVERPLSLAQRHARDLVPTLRELLAEVGWRVTDVTAVAVSRGPGSFTGLRVGVLTAKTFAYATGCALVALDTFAVLAEPWPGRVVVVADAQQQNVYTQTFVDRAPTTAVQLLSARAWADTLADARVTGPGLNKWAALVPPAQLTSAEHWLPSAAAAVRVAQRAWHQGERADVYGLEPLYVRASAAEENARGAG
jgi:tRNA threonylcarbamoyladenosine biosynthesis protein TsaB